MLEYAEVMRLQAEERLMAQDNMESPDCPICGEQMTYDEVLCEDYCQPCEEWAATEREPVWTGWNSLD